VKPKECDGGEGDHFYSGGGGRGDCGGSGGGHIYFTCGQPDHWAVHLVETVVEMAATLLMIAVIGTWQSIICSFSSSPRTIKTWSHTDGGAHFGGQ